MNLLQTFVGDRTVNLMSNPRILLLELCEFISVCSTGSLDGVTPCATGSFTLDGEAGCFWIIHEEATWQTALQGWYRVNLQVGAKLTISYFD